MTTSNNSLFQLEELFTKIFIEREINRLEINMLNLALLSGSLDEEQRRIVSRIFYGLRRGWLTVNDVAEQEISAIKNRLPGVNSFSINCNG